MKKESPLNVERYAKMPRQEVEKRIGALKSNTNLSWQDCQCLAQMYWGIGDYSNAGRMYETAISKHKEVKASQQSLNELTGELDMLKRTTVYGGSSANELPPVQVNTSPVTKPKKKVPMALIIAIGAVASVILVAGTFAVSNSIKNSITSQLPQQLPEVTGAQEYKDIKEADDGADVQQSVAQQVPTQGSSFKTVATAESIDLPAADVYKWMQDGGGIGTWEFYKPVFNQDSMYKPKYYAPEKTGIVHYTIKDASYISEEYPAERYFAILHLRADPSSLVVTYDRTSCYMAIEVEYENGKATILKPRKPTYYFEPKLNELYQTLDGQNGVYTPEIVEF